MASSVVVLRGVVVDRSAGEAPARGHACLTSGHESLAEAAMDENGAFELRAALGTGGRCQLSVFAGSLEAWRRTLDLKGGQEVDLGTIELQQTEYEPGIHGHLWDATADRLLLGGRVQLEQAEQRLATAAPGLEGAFLIQMSCSQPLPAGDYVLVADAPGFGSARVPVAIVDEVTAYQLGRIELMAAESSDAAG